MPALFDSAYLELLDSWNRKLPSGIGKSDYFAATCR
jgi:hypothetical protein